MIIELYAIAASGRQAIVRCAGRWHRLYHRSGRWCLEDLGEREPPDLRWDTSYTRVRIDYPSFADLMTSLEAAASGADSEDVSAALRGASRNRSAWSEEFPSILSLLQGRVDALFARLGCSAEEAFSLILETFWRAYLLGSSDLETIEDLLPQLALDVFREKHGDTGRLRVPRKDLDRTRSGTTDDALQCALAGLDSLTLRCLAVCSEPLLRQPHFSREGRAAKLFDLSEEEVHLRLELAVARLGGSRDQLVEPKMHAAYKEELSRRID